MLRHIHETGGTSSCFSSASLVMAVERVNEAWLVSRVNRSTEVARLLKIVDTSIRYQIHSSPPQNLTWLTAISLQTFGEKSSRERPFAALRVTLLERCPGCHPERSEGSLRPANQTRRCAQGDRHYLQMSN